MLNSVSVSHMLVYLHQTLQQKLGLQIFYRTVTAVLPVYGQFIAVPGWGISKGK